jgi:hypothetical protein
MRNHPRIIAAIVFCVIAIGMTALAGLRGSQESNGQDKGQKKSQKMIEAESRLPVADYGAAEPTDPKEREKRIKKGKKYEKPEYADLTINDSSEVVTTFSHWASGLSATPTDRSATIIVGNVTEARAFISPGKIRVYSEFRVDVSEVLKDDADSSIKCGSSLVIDRIGGRVQFANGNVGQYWISGQGMPRVGGRYLLFLTKPDADAGYSILTGYELRDGHVYLLDNPGAGHPITTREGTDEASLLNEVRAAVSGN